MANDFSNVVDKIIAKSFPILRANSIMPRKVNTDWANEVAERGDTIDVDIPSAMTVSDVAPAAVPIAGQDVTPTKVQIPLSRWRQTEMHITDKQAHEIAEGKENAQFSSAIAALANDVDQYILSLYTGIYGFVGTPGTDPFGSNLDDATAAKKVLNRQLTPMIGPRTMVLNSDAMAEALQNRAIQDASFRRQGDDSLRTGTVGEVMGFEWQEDQNVDTSCLHTNGTLTDGTGHQALVNNAAVAVGDTSCAFDETSLTGTVTKGSVFTVAGDNQHYVVTALATAAANAITLSFSPAVQVAWADDAQMTLKGTASETYVNNIAFHRDCFALAIRPVSPPGGFTGGHIIRPVQDPVSGIGFSLEISREHMRTKWTWSVLYGAIVARAALGVRIAGA